MTLPHGWTQNQITGTAINWISSITTPNSAPNTMFANNPATINATALESPSFLVTSGEATVSFQKAFTTESTFDGVVFEIKIGAGAWADILTAGGSFITGGYNAIINSNATNGSPIVGRPAWSGTSAAFTSTQVMLPSAANGQNVQLRWLMASDKSVASTGFRLDDVVINASVTCTPCSTLPLNLLSFTGAKKDGYNLLQWKTANEINTNNFVLQYSVDGSNFKNAYNIAAIGSGNNNYQQKDNGEWIKDALIFYRLKMIDNDGQFTFSNIVTIKNNKASKLASTIYPNPTKENCKLTIGERNLIGTSAQVFDIAGKLLQTKTIAYNTQVIYMNNYLPGVYLIKLVNGETFRIIKL